MSDNTPQRDEAHGKHATVDFRGHKFQVTREYDDWSVDLLESLEEGKTVGIVRGALGPEQWRVVKGMNLKVRDLGELANRIAVALGFGDAGESAASSD
jgi:hypothetical protein